jgi:hypothetical protein
MLLADSCSKVRQQPEEQLIDMLFTESCESLNTTFPYKEIGPKRPDKANF